MYAQRDEGLPADPGVQPAREGGEDTNAQALLGERSRSSVGLLLVTILGVLGVTAVADRGHEAAPTTDSGMRQPASWPARPNLFLISLDTLRRDRLGCYGYEKPTTPEIDRLAAESMRFTSAFTHHPWTLTAHMTMLTGMYPSVHGVLQDRGLADATPTVAGSLSEAGYATFAVVDQVPWLRSDYGFGRGFDSYRSLAADASGKVDEILTTVDSLQGQAFFCFAHFFDAHSDCNEVPYEARPEDRAAFAGTYEDDFGIEREDWGNASEMLVRMHAEGVVPPEEDQAHLSDLYNAGVRSLDREIGRLLRGLEERGLLENSVVILTSDHGEEFYEHGSSLHFQQYDECLAVPFLVYTPETAASRGLSHDALVGHVDIGPTLLEFAGLQSEAVQGISLAPLTSGRPLASQRDYLLLDNSMFLGLRSREVALIFNPTGVGFFDLATDPEQQRNLFELDEHQEALRAHARLLKAETQRMKPARDRYKTTAGGIQVGPRARQDLDALGYGGG